MADSKVGSVRGAMLCGFASVFLVGCAGLLGEQLGAAPPPPSGDVAVDPYTAAIMAEGQAHQEAQIKAEQDAIAAQHAESERMEALTKQKEQDDAKQAVAQKAARLSADGPPVCASPAWVGDGWPRQRRGRARAGEAVEARTASPPPLHTYPPLPHAIRQLDPPSTGWGLVSFVCGGVRGRP